MIKRKSHIKRYSQREVNKVIYFWSDYFSFNEWEREILNNYFRGGFLFWKPPSPTNEPFRLVKDITVLPINEAVELLKETFKDRGSKTYILCEPTNDLTFDWSYMWSDNDKIFFDLADEESSLDFIRGIENEIRMIISDPNVTLY